MKYLLSIVFLFVFWCIGSAQNGAMEFPKRFTPTIVAEQLYSSQNVYEIMPEFYKHIALSYKDRDILDNMIKSKYPEGYFFYPYISYTYPKDDISNLLDIESFEIKATNYNKTVSEKAYGVQLSDEQKNILKKVPFGENINIHITFKYKNPKYRNIYFSGDYTVTVVPMLEATYPGGNEKIADFYKSKVINKLSQKVEKQIIWNASVKFVVDETRKVTNPKMEYSTSDAKLDKIVLEATNNMPKWQPAKNAIGKNVKQEIIVRFGGGC